MGVQSILKDLRRYVVILNIDKAASPDDAFEHISSPLIGSRFEDAE